MFMALFAGAVFLADGDEVGPLGAVLVGIVAGLAALTRSIGVAVIAGVAVGLLLRGRRRESLIATTVALLVTAPWFLWVANHATQVDPRIAANYGTYGTAAQQAGIRAFLAGLDLRALVPLAKLLLPVDATWIRIPLSILLLAVGIAGAVIIARRGPAFIASLIAYTAIVTVWPFTPDRFMWVVTPWVIALIGWGIAWAWNRGRAYRVVSAAIALTFLVGYVPREVVSLRHRAFATTALDLSLADRVLLPSIDDGVPKDAVIAAEGEATIYLYTGRLAVPNRLFRWSGRSLEYFPVPDVQRFLCDSKVNYIALSAPGSEGAPVVKALSSDDKGEVAPAFAVTGGPALYRFQCQS
jgi:hypothetical protein